ncbi:MAG: methylenetetrahydrofolate--tRNA-(uracil(54)-C(5))-methyltransferase (FADH(2)-oxidizing) TrmFO [Acutalibacteraceae bacterium]|nr:methylenetetrahydrofolate--tRNA-(uracil(54)-C(5))-methyltransferase (FADH(2)-oxidizing) TrmFO [Acutalibacteraceae bacterium]
MQNKITVIGAGLAGCEAAYAIANKGIKVDLIEMKPLKKTPAHKTDNYAELVCSNSLKANRVDSAAGLLKQEMRLFGSVCLDAAEVAKVPAGGALAVDRDVFSGLITEKIKNTPNINVINKIVTEIPKDAITVIATGPLTDGALAESIEKFCDTGNLNFYDAAAPIVTAESIDFDNAFTASRYDKGDSGDGDYINCPMNKQEYEDFYSALVTAESAPLHDFDKPFKVYEGCMPIEVLARRGEDSIRFGPMKPVGLRDPRTGHRPWAVVQLRKENKEGTLYNLVGFQTNLKFGEQKRVFSMIPALKNAEFMRYGVMHRNSFINSPKLLNHDLSLKKADNIFFAGQLSGVEGYMESAACGIIAGLNAANKLLGKEPIVLPKITMIGALLDYITDPSVTNFQPMGANFGILPMLETKIKDKRERYAALSKRSLDFLEDKFL